MRSRSGTSTAAAGRTHGSTRVRPAAAIITVATLAEVYDLPPRAIGNLLRRVVELLGLCLPVPCYQKPRRRRLN
jgi:hypothetical protein